ncbi:MAG: nicotinate-nicotinamide nucleotide adenylyltransferase [Vibrionaceae bacterium]
MCKNKFLPKKSWAVFGSAFNPPTLGHLNVLQKLTAFDRVLLVPSFHHAWAKPMAPFSLRCEWVLDFIDDAKLGNLQLCTDEQHIKGEVGEAVTTWDLLKFLQEKHHDCMLTFVMGPDNLLNFAKFYRAEEILARWSVLTCPEEFAIRSSDLRQKLANGDNFAHLTTPTVARKLSSSTFLQGNIKK